MSCFCNIVYNPLLSIIYRAKVYLLCKLTIMWINMDENLPSVHKIDELASGCADAVELFVWVVLSNSWVADIVHLQLLLCFKLISNQKRSLFTSHCFSAKAIFTLQSNCIWCYALNQSHSRNLLYLLATAVRYNYSAVCCMKFKYIMYFATKRVISI